MSCTSSSSGLGVFMKALWLMGRVRRRGVIVRAVVHRLFAQAGVVPRPCEVTLALLGRHGATDFKEMFEHLALTGGPHSRPLTQELFNLRRDLRGAGQRIRELVVQLV